MKVAEAAAEIGALIKLANCGNVQAQRKLIAAWESLKTTGGRKPAAKPAKVPALEYPNLLFCLLAHEMDPATDEVRREILNVERSPARLEMSSIPNCSGKQVAVYELKEVNQYETVYDEYDYPGDDFALLD